MIGPILILMLLMQPVPGYAQTQDAGSAVQALIASDRAFGRAAREAGAPAAFREYLAEESFVFNPRPMPGAEVLRKAVNDPARVQTWEPEYAEVSRAGDLGYTTGPWRYSIAKKGGQAELNGHYVTVWVRQGGGPWKVRLRITVRHDLAVPSPNQVATPDLAVLKAPSPAAGADPGRVMDSLLAADRGWARAASTAGGKAAFQSIATDDVRVLRQLALPAAGRPAAERALAGSQDGWAWEPASAGAAASGDLGYTYGTAGPELSSGKTRDPHSYVRIWRMSTEGQWKLALDISIPAPQPE